MQIEKPVLSRETENTQRARDGKAFAAGDEHAFAVIHSKEDQ
jgi:hypothetical protein